MHVAFTTKKHVDRTARIQVFPITLSSPEAGNILFYSELHHI